MSRESKLIVDQLIKDLRDRTMDFTCGECTLDDKKTKIEYWIGNGIILYGICNPYTFRFGIVQGYRFGVALRKWKAANMIALSKEDR